MSKLDAALAWARRNFRVFPLQLLSKDPCDLAWTLHATTDEGVIRSWWTDPVTGFERDLNVGFLTTDWIVADVDVKRGKPGLETMARLGLEFDTLCMRTPTGGYHLVYRGLAEPVGQSPLGTGIDVRSHHGYVAAPGSELDVIFGDDEDPLAVVNCKAGELERRLQNGARVERRTYEVEIDQPVLDFPAHLAPLLKKPRRRADVVPADVDLDAPETVELVAHWLLHDAPPAVEGLNGDDATYRVCCRIRDFGVSEATALGLFLDEYNPRCEPPWSPEEAALKLENAYRYATGAPGRDSPAAAFGHVVPVEIAAPAPGVRQEALGGVASYGNVVAEADIPPRPWVLHGMLMRGVVTTLVAPGGAGKSVLSLIVAAHLATGRDFLGHRCVEPGRSIVYNAEDDRAEMSRRLLAVVALYGLDAAEVLPRVALWSSEDLELQVTTGAPPVLNPDHVRRLLEACADPELAMLSIDPLVEVHTGRENDTSDMRAVMGLLRSVARTAKAPILVVQHTGKPANGQSSHAGDQNAGRGSSAVPAAARVVLTLAVATEQECAGIGAPTSERTSYVRLDGAKATALAARDRPTERWLRWESHRLVNGDAVGVLVPHDAAAAARNAAQAIARAVARHLVSAGTASVSFDEAAAIANRAGLGTTKAGIMRTFDLPVQIDGHEVAMATGDDGRRQQRLVMR